ncbi:MAG: tetratricopeptide repeat protein [Thaumarchaeota archaeon S15]|nr:MAG: tetratricopeptide repeat protein [Thaumarchaeota archaeon S15]
MLGRPVGHDGDPAELVVRLPEARDERGGVKRVARSEELRPVVRDRPERHELFVAPRVRDVDPPAHGRPVPCGLPGVAHEDRLVLHEHRVPLALEAPRLRNGAGLPPARPARAGPAGGNHGRPLAREPELAQGAVLRSLGRAEETLRCCDRAIELDPGRADARNNRGRALMDLERHEEAVEELDMAIGMDPKSSDAHVNRGIALHRLGRHDEAIMSLRRSVLAGRNDATVWFYIGALLFQTGRLSESLGAVDDAIKIRPDYARAHHARGTVLHRLDRRDEANAAFGRAHELDPAFEVPVLPDEVDDIYVAWHGAMDIRNRLASPTSPGYVMRHQIRSHIAEFLNSAKRALEYHEKQHKSDIVRDYHRLETRTRKYLQYVNETKHERLLDVRIEKTGRRTRVYPNTRTGRPMITIEEGVGLVRDGRNYDISTWPDDMFRGDIDRGFVYEEQVCYVVLRDGEVEVVEFMDTILGGVRGLLERHGYGTSVLANAGSYYGLP